MNKKLHLIDIKDRLKIINEFDGQLVHGGAKFNKDTKRTGIGRPSSGFMTPQHAEIIEKNDEGISIDSDVPW